MNKHMASTLRYLPLNRTIALSLGLGICLVALLCLKISPITSNLATIWLPTALLTSVLFHRRYREWPVLLVCAALGILLADMISGYLPPGNIVNPHYLANMLNNLIEASMCAALLRHYLDSQEPLAKLGDWINFLSIAVVCTPLFGAVLMMVFNSTELNTMREFITWYISEAVATVALVPVGLLLRRDYLQQLKASGRLKNLLITLFITLLTSVMAMKWIPFPFAFITLPLLLAAIRLPQLDAFIVFLSVTLIITPLQPNQIVTIIPGMLGLADGLVFVPLLLILLPINVVTMVMHALRVEKSNIIESENRFRHAMEYSAIGMALVSPDGHWLQVNKALCNLLGYEPSELKKSTFQQITHPDDLERDLLQKQRLLDGEIVNYMLEKRYLCRNGQMVWTLLTVSVVRNEADEPLYFISQVKDITELKQTELTNKRLTEALHEEKERLHITLNSINEAVISTDRQMNITFMNPVAERMTGWNQQQAQGHPVSRIVHISNGIDGPLIVDFSPFDGYENQAQSLVLHGHHGSSFDVQLSVSPLKTLSDEPIGSVLVLQDVSKSRELMRQLSYNASHDLLTGLSNRGYFEERFKNALALTQQQGQQHCLAFIDLDRFKAVNDTAGHAAGDEVLRQLSQLMQDNLRNSDTVARLGGDEFAILFVDCRIEQGQQIIQKLINRINEFDFSWNHQIFHIGASAGITGINSSRFTASEYMAQADVACYTAKHNGRGQICLYEHALKTHNLAEKSA